MKIKKQVLFILGVLSLVAVLTPFTVFAQNDVSIRIPNVIGFAGETVSVPVEVKNNPGILGAALTFSFDEELILMSAENGDAFQDLTLTKPGKFDSHCKFSWDGQELTEGNHPDGVILLLSYKIPDNAKVGDKYTISASCENKDFVNSAFQEIVPTIVSGSIEVADLIYGDLNGDKVVNTTDTILLRRQIVGGYEQTIHEIAGDVNCDDVLNTTDTILLRRYIVGGYDVTFPYQESAVGHAMEVIPVPGSNNKDDALCWYCKTCDQYYKDKDGTEVADLVEYEGIVTNTYLTAPTIDVNDDKIHIDVKKVNGYQRSAEEWDTYEAFIPATGFAEGTTDAAAFIGKYVVCSAVYCESTEETVLVHIEAKTEKNNVIVIDASQIEYYSSEELEYFVDENAVKATRIDLEVTLSLYNNGYDSVYAVEDFLERVISGDGAYGTVTLIDNNNDEIYDVMMVMESSGHFLVDAVSDDEILLVNNYGDLFEINLSTETEIIKLYNADGTKMMPDDITQNAVLTLYENCNNVLLTAYISTAVVEGVITEFYPYVYVINGNEYEVAYDQNGPTVMLSIGDEGVFYLNAEDEIVAKRSIPNSEYAYLYKAITVQDINGKNVEMKYLTTEGVWETNTFASKVKVVLNGSSRMVNIATAEAFDFGGFLVDISNGYDDTSFVEGTMPLFQFFTNNEGKISEIRIGEGSHNDNSALSLDRVEVEKTYDATTKRIGSILLNEDTKVFAVSSETWSENDIVLTTVKDAFVDGSLYNYVAAYDITHGVPNIVVAYDVKPEIQADGNVFVISRVSEILNESGNRVTKLSGYQGGEMVSIELTDGYCNLIDRNGYDYPSTLRVGDVILYAEDFDGKVAKIQVLMSYSEARYTISANEKGFAAEGDDGYSANILGFVTANNNGLISLKENFNGTLLPDATGADLTLFLNDQAVNIYEINLNQYNNNLCLLEGVKDILAVNRFDRDAHWAYVRTYNGTVIDVVVYKTTTPSEESMEEVMGESDDEAGEEGASE